MKHNTAHQRFAGICIYTLAFILAIGILSMGSSAKAQDTTASIKFLDGELVLDGEVDGSGLSLDFGENSIPAIAQTYSAKNAVDGVPENHILKVEDTRFESGNWYVTVSLSSFVASEAEAPSFDGMIRMRNPAVANKNTSTGIDGLTVKDDLAIASGGTPQSVMTANGDLLRGVYSATWVNDNVTLHLSDVEVLKIIPETYQATLTWTLTQGPQ